VRGVQTWRLAPVRAQPLVRVLSWVPAVGLVGGLAGLIVYLSFTSRMHVPWYLWIGKGGLMKVSLVGGAGAALARVWGRVAASFLRRSAQVYGMFAGQRPRDGALVRVEGTVRQQECFTSAVSGEAAVFAHYEVRWSTQDRPDSAWARTVWQRGNEIRGVDFLVGTDLGQPVRIHAEDVFLTTAPYAEWKEAAEPAVIGHAPNGSYREAIISPGDRIEAIGILTHEVDPDADRPNPREMPKRLTLRGTRRVPLLVRLLERPGTHDHDQTLP